MGLWSNKILMPRRARNVSRERLSIIPAHKDPSPQTEVKPAEIVTSRLPMRRGRSWKRLTILACFAAAGFGFAVALICAGVYWYSRLSRAPKGWNEKAIQAIYVGTKFQEEGKENTLRVKLMFDLWNTTGYDYTLEARPSATMMVMQKVKSEPSLVDGIGLTWTVEHGSGSGQ